MAVLIERENVSSQTKTIKVQEVHPYTTYQGYFNFNYENNETPMHYRRTMRSSIQTFSIKRAGWENDLLIDFTDSNCCIITGSNGGGKTLTMRMLELVGKWLSDPTRYNFDRMCGLAEKTQIEEITALIRTPLIVGRENYAHTNHWTTGFCWDPYFFPTSNVMQQDRINGDDFDFVADVARLCETKICFGSDFNLKRRMKLSIHYMTRHKSHRSERDKELELFYSKQKVNDKSFTPMDKLSFENPEQPHVFEHGVLCGENWKIYEAKNAGYSPINEPNADDLIDSKTIVELLAENGILIEESRTSPSNSIINLPRPVALNVERRPQDIIADMDAIRKLDLTLFNPESLFMYLKEGHQLHNQRFNTDSQTSPIVMDAVDGEFVDVGPMELDPFEQHYITMSQPYFPSWFAFKRFVGHIPAVNYLSSGQLQLLSMTKAVLATDYNSLLMIDEPELSLHIDWQRELIHFFTSVFPHHTFLFSTHSPDILYNEIKHVLQVPPVRGEVHHE